MQIRTQEHADVMDQFEKEFRGIRFDKEAKDFWPRGRIYEDGQTNELFLAYRRGYALARCVYGLPLPPSPDAQTEEEEKNDAH